MTTGQRIKAAREKAGVTQAKLAEWLNVPYQSISQWERDVRNPKKETLFKIADALCVPVGELYAFPNDLDLKDRQDKINWIIQKIKKSHGTETNELLYQLGIAYDNYDYRADCAAALEDAMLGLSDDELIAKIQSWLLEYTGTSSKLSDEELALKTLLNCLGYDIEKECGEYYFYLDLGDSNRGRSLVSDRDVFELIQCTQSGLKTAAKSLELKVISRQDFIKRLSQSHQNPPQSPQPPKEEPTPENG